MIAIAKTIQKIASSSFFLEGKEDYMSQLNSFVEQNFTKKRTFINQLAEKKENLPPHVHPQADLRKDIIKMLSKFEKQRERILKQVSDKEIEENVEHLFDQLFDDLQYLDQLGQLKKGTN